MEEISYSLGLTYHVAKIKLTNSNGISVIVVCFRCSHWEELEQRMVMVEKDAHLSGYYCDAPRTPKSTILVASLIGCATKRLPPPS
jgi:hypothetical protein